MSVLAEKSLPDGSPESRGMTSEQLESSIQEVRVCPCCEEPLILTPRIVCGHCQHALEIKCHVYRSGGVWYAECLTLNLLSKGESEVEAIRRLQVAMFSYVETVLRDGQSAEGLIPRYAPKSSWIAYYVRNFFARLFYVFGRKSSALIRAVPIQGVAALKVSHCA
jgi:hypothetical protein